MALPLRASRLAREVWLCEEQAFVAGASWLAAGPAQAILHPELPEVWDASFVGRVPQGARPKAVLDAASTLLGGAGCAHVKIVLDDPGGFGLGPGFTRLGLVERSFVTMSTRRIPPLPAPSPVVVRAVRTQDDRLAMSQVREAVRSEAPWFAPEVSQALDAWEDLQASALDLTWLLAWLDGAPAGAVGLLVTERGASLQSLATHPRLRRRGVGSALVREVVRRGLARGAPWVSLLTERDDRPRRLYRRLGFREVGQVREYVRGGL